MPRRAPRPLTKGYPVPHAQAANFCHAVVRVDGTGTRKKIKKDYEKALRDLDHSRRMGIASAGGQVLVFYPLSGSNNVLQTATNLAGPWVPATGGVPLTALIFSNSAPVQFFRLQ